MIGVVEISFEQLDRIAEYRNKCKVYETGLKELTELDVKRRELEKSYSEQVGNLTALEEELYELDEHLRELGITLKPPLELKFYKPQAEIPEKGAAEVTEKLKLTPEVIGETVGNLYDGNSVSKKSLITKLISLGYKVTTWSFERQTHLAKERGLISSEPYKRGKMGYYYPAGKKPKLIEDDIPYAVKYLEEQGIKPTGRSIEEKFGSEYDFTRRQLKYMLSLAEKDGLIACTREKGEENIYRSI